MDCQIACTLDLYKINYIVYYEDNVIYRCEVAYDYNFIMSTKLCILTVYDENDVSVCVIKERRKLVPYKRFYEMELNNGKKIILRMKIKGDTIVESSELPIFNNCKWRKHNLNWCLLAPLSESYTTAAECKYDKLEKINLYIHDEYISHLTEILSMIIAMITENLDKGNVINNVGI